MSAPASREIRLVLLVCLTLVVLSSAPTAAARTGAAGERTDEAAALRLLERAAEAARTVGYAGTQYVASWSATGSSSTLAEVAHDPVQGTVVTRPSSAGPTAELVSPDGGPAALQRRLLDALARSYALRVAGTAACTGRTAHVVEARRPGGPSAVAGRFWVDRDSGLLLRREVYDDTGRAVRSSAFLDLALVPEAASPARVERPGAAPAERAALRSHSTQWKAPQELPGGFVLYDAQLRDHDRRVHLSYSDGLSTLSLFAQHGSLGDGPDGAFTRTTLDGSRVWTSDSVPQRVVWSGGGQVWTLVADAPAEAVHAAVVALPHDAPPDDGVLARLGRGLERMGGMLNPFA